MTRFLRYAGLAIVALALPLAGIPTHAHAQTDWPTQPVKIVAANTPGTAVDIMARVIAQGLTQQLGQQFVVENRPGGGGTIGADAVARAPADGYTILVISPPLTVITPNLRKDLPYDPIKSFAPVTLFASTDNVLVANPKLPNTLEGIVEYAKANPGKLRMGNGGTGYQGHLAAVTLANAAGIEVLHVPYKGSAFIPAVVSGEVDLAITGVPLVLGIVRSGSANAIGVASLKRSSELPDTPTFDELGLTGFESGGWTGLAVGAGTPQAIVDKLAQAVTKALADEKLRKQIISAGGSPWGTTPEEAAKLIAEEFESYGKVIRDNNISATAN